MMRLFFLSRLLPICALAVLTGPETLAQEARLTLRSTVTGNQEQPRVMYIVPWQQPGSSRVEYAIDSTIAAELFTPLDRDEFVRALRYEVKISSSSNEDFAGR